jgi:hypothetical protein
LCSGNEDVAALDMLAWPEGQCRAHSNVAGWGSERWKRDGEDVDYRIDATL